MLSDIYIKYFMRIDLIRIKKYTNPIRKELRMLSIYPAIFYKEEGEDIRFASPILMLPLAETI